jgi:type II secretory pathway component HofQ
LPGATRSTSWPRRRTAVEERGGGVLAVTSPPMVNIQLENVEIRQVIDTIAVGERQRGRRQEVTGSVSVRFNDVPWREALDVVQDARLSRRRREARRAARRVA